MSDWIKYSEQKPKQGMDLWYFFDMVGAHKGQYYGGWLFGGKNGFLQYDVTHWQYDVRQEKPERPTDPTANDSDIELMRKVCDWYADNKHMFKTDEFYGIDIEADLFRLVKSCMEIK